MYTKAGKITSLPRRGGSFIKESIFQSIELRVDGIFSDSYERRKRERETESDVKAITEAAFCRLRVQTAKCFSPTIGIAGSQTIRDVLSLDHPCDLRAFPSAKTYLRTKALFPPAGSQVAQINRSLTNSRAVPRKCCSHELSFVRFFVVESHPTSLARKRKEEKKSPRSLPRFAIFKIAAAFLTSPLQKNDARPCRPRSLNGAASHVDFRSPMRGIPD